MWLIGCTASIMTIIIGNRRRHRRRGRGVAMFMFIAGGDLTLVQSVLLTRVGEGGGGEGERNCCGCRVVVREWFR